MGQRAARLLYACAISALAGCSLIYNPSNLPDKGSQPPDAAIADANPALLQLDAVKSTPLLEGAGQGGSAPHVLVVYGAHITNTATITITPKTPDPRVELVVSNLSVADDGNSFAALVGARYMDAIDETGPNASGAIPLAITVTQVGATPRSIDWTLRPLDELTTAGPQSPPPPGKLFSRVDVTGDIAFATGGMRAIVRAVGEIVITGKVSANADGRDAGTGGCRGGSQTGDGECPGGGKSGGGGGGFAMPGGDGAAATGGDATGDPFVSAFEGGANRGGGGGGGGGLGGEGGGGGGGIELTAGGNITVGALEAKGAGGAGSAVGRGGGGGSGGAIVLRAGGTLVQPTMVDVRPGGGAAGIGAGGDGSVGRWRYDAVTSTGTPPQSPAPRRGPMIVPPANPIFESSRPTLMIRGEAGSRVTLLTLYPDGPAAQRDVTLTAETSLVVPEQLAIGLGTLCVLVPAGNFAEDVAKNCIDVAFVP